MISDIVRRGRMLALVVLAGLTGSLPFPGSVAGGVLQRVTVIQGDTPLIDPVSPGDSAIRADLSPGSFPDSAQQEIFGVTSGDINAEVFAQVAGSNGFGPYAAGAAAGRFGSLAAATRILQETATGAFSGARVLIASDEVVNVTGQAQSAVANFIVDGGFLQGVRADYRLVIGAANLGSVGITTTRSDLERLLFLVDEPFFFHAAFASQGSVNADAAGHIQYVRVTVPNATVNSDLGATFDPVNRRLDIPLSAQSLDLGTLEPGDRLLLFYSLYLETSSTFPGGAFAQFSDPLSLSGRVNFPAVTLTPVSGDADEDGVADADDACPGTSIPEPVPTIRLEINRFALVDRAGSFHTTTPPGAGPQKTFTVADTAGCSCAQIIARLGLGAGHEKFGCSISAMEEWIARVGR